MVTSSKSPHDTPPGAAACDRTPSPGAKPSLFQAIFSASCGSHWLSGSLLFLALFLPLHTGCDGKLHTPQEVFIQPGISVLEATATTWIYWYGLGAVVLFLAFACWRHTGLVKAWNVFNGIVYVLVIGGLLGHSQDYREWAVFFPPLIVHVLWVAQAVRQKAMIECAARLQTGCVGLGFLWLWLLTIFHRRLEIGFFVAAGSLAGMLMAAWIARVRLSHDLLDRNLSRSPLRFSLWGVMLVVTLTAFFIAYYQFIFNS